MNREMKAILLNCSGLDYINGPLWEMTFYGIGLVAIFRDDAKYPPKML